MDCLAAARTMPETRYANSGGVHIAYQVVGDGPLDVLFVMGWVTNMDYFWQEPGFARFLRRLASFSRLIMVDKRGTGLSDRVAGLPTLEERMDDIRVVMDAVGSKRAALVGVSEGGSMAILFAATYPERTSNLVLVGTAPRWLWAPDWPWSPTQREIDARLKAIERGFGTVEWATRDLERRAPSMARNEEFRRWWMTYVRMGASPGAAIALALMNLMIDNRHVLPSIRVPTLIVHRTGDLIARVEAARYMAANIRGARYVELPGDEHLPFVGDQDEILAQIEQFLGARRSTAEPDTVLATALAVELCDSGQTMAGVGECRWQDLQRTFTQLSHSAIDAQRGRAVTVASDRLVAVFDGPSRAIRCAQAIVDQCAELGIRVRGGLHTGECLLVDGEPGGLPLRTAAWAMSQANSGEVLATSTVRDLVSGSGIAFDDTNARLSAPGPGGAWRLFRVDARRPVDTTSSAAAIAAHSRTRDQLTRREREVVALLARGRTNREIADTLIISERTVENHVSNVLAKLGLESRAQVAVWVLSDEASRDRLTA
jgi:pimeloyl-ACP methyl ester carboxylesterase/DNA-binding CsgD family transcriptional regulator/class 3 adenylate cyclase